MLKYKNEKVIDCFELDKLVQETYNRPYCFQQQDGCKSRGSEYFTIPEESYDEFDITFEEWLNKDPKEPIENQQYDWQLETWWERKFYPAPEAILNDLHSKGLIEAGDYTIKIDW